MTQRRFLCNDQPIENVKSFCYVGIVMSKYGNFNNAKKHLGEQASKARYGVFRKKRYVKLPCDCQLDLFGKVISSILLYSCEVGGMKTLIFLRRYI